MEVWTDELIMRNREMQFSYGGDETKMLNIIR